MRSKFRVLMFAIPLFSMSFASLAAECKKSSSSSSSSSSSCSEHCTWGLDPTFNACSTTPGILIAPTSPFLDIAESIAIDNCDRDCCKERYLIGADSVNLPNYCSGAVDGHIDERDAAIQAFNHAGTRDVSFAQNGVLLFNTSIFGSYSNTVLVQCSEGACNDIFVVGNSQTNPSGEFSSATIGNCNPYADCGFQVSQGDYDTPQYLAQQAYLARFNCNGSPTAPNGEYEDVNGNSVSFLTIDPSENSGYGFGSIVNKAIWQDSNTQQIIAVGTNSPDLSGCFPSNPEAIKIETSDGSVTWDTIENASNWIDCLNPYPNFGFGQFESATTFGGSIYAVGDADVTTADDFWPNTSRGIVAKISPTTLALDPTFGHVTISANGEGAPDKQIILRSIATDGAYLYLGGDIADAFSGAAGQTTPPTPGAPGDILGRISANFLVIRLNMDGTPASINSTVNQNTIQLNWNKDGGPCTTFNAIQTDFFGSEDAIFALKIDGDRLVAAGFSAFGPDIESQRPIVARYRVNNELMLDTSFNSTGYVYLKDISPFRALARDLAISSRSECHKRYLITGQAAVGPVVRDPVTFSDATETNSFIAALSREDEE